MEDNSLPLLLRGATNKPTEREAESRESDNIETILHTITTVLDLPHELLTHIGVLIRQSDLAAILTHELDWRRCFDLEARNPSHLRAWYSRLDVLLAAASANLRSFRLVNTDFALAGAHAAIAVTSPVDQPRRIWAHELPWDLDFCPWRQIVLTTSSSSVQHFLAVSRNDVLCKAVRTVKFVILPANKTDPSRDCQDGLFKAEIFTSMCRLVNLESISVRNGLYDTVAGERGLALEDVGQRRQQLEYFERLVSAISSGSSKKVKALSFSDIDSRLLTPPEAKGLLSEYEDVLKHVASLELRFWQYMAPHHKESWESANARELWQLVIKGAPVLEKLTIWNVPNNRRWDSTVYEHWGRHSDDAKLLESITSTNLQSLELVDIRINAEVLGDILCRHAATLKQLRLTWPRFEPKKGVVRPLLLRLKEMLHLNQCIMEWPPKSTDWEEYYEWWDARDIITEKYQRLDQSRMKDMMDIGSYLLPSYDGDQSTSSSANSWLSAT